MVFSSPNDSPKSLLIPTYKVIPSPTNIFVYIVLKHPSVLVQR